MHAHLHAPVHACMYACNCFDMSNSVVILRFLLNFLMQEYVHKIWIMKCRHACILACTCSCMHAIVLKFLFQLLLLGLSINFQLQVYVHKICFMKFQQRSHLYAPVHAYMHFLVLFSAGSFLLCFKMRRVPSSCPCFILILVEII